MTIQQRYAASTAPFSAPVRRLGSCLHEPEKRTGTLYITNVRETQTMATNENKWFIRYDHWQQNK
jgi:hypothetical protein